MENEIKDRFKSPFGWWVATQIERYEYENEDSTNPKRRCRVWTNTIILKANNRDEAYDKAVKYGNLGKADSYDYVDSKTGRKARIVFEGLSSLLPIYDEIDEDGTEIVFDDDFVTVGRLKSWVRKKEELEVFEDLKI